MSDLGKQTCPMCGPLDGGKHLRSCELGLNLELEEGRRAQHAAQEAIRREVEGDGGLGELLAQTLGVELDALEEWNASGLEDPQRIPRPLEELARATPATELPPELAAALRLSEAMREAPELRTRCLSCGRGPDHDHDPAVETSCPDAIAAQRRELSARRRLDDLAVHVLEAFLDVLDAGDDLGRILDVVETLSRRARYARWDESLRDDPDAQRLTSLESVVRIAHAQAVEIVDLLGGVHHPAEYADDLGDRDVVEIHERAHRIARMTHEVLTGTPRQEADDE